MPAYIRFPTTTQLRNVFDPTANTDAATKYYVDKVAEQTATDLLGAQANNFVLKTGDTITGIINIANTTQAESNTTGAFIVAGGVGVSGNLFSTAIYSNNYYGIIDAGKF
jgi:hypothetical protein